MILKSRPMACNTEYAWCLFEEGKMSVGTGRTYGASCLDKRDCRGGDGERIHVEAGPPRGCPVLLLRRLNVIASSSQRTKATPSIIN